MIRWLLALAAPLMLASCIITPAKFTSTLDIRADRSFTFTYVGEVELMKSKAPPNFSADAEDDGDGSDDQSFGDDDGPPQLFQIGARGGKKLKPIRLAAKGAKDKGSADKGDPGKAALTSSARSDEDFGDSQDEVTQLKAIAEALSREYGFRSVRYIGGRKLAIDYRITGKLDHAFIFPFNPDGNVVLPFIAIELRGKDRVRIKAPGYANEQSMAASLGGNIPGMGGASSSSSLDGTFTLTTDATVVSQNQEDGVQTQPDGTKKVVWRATPQTKDAPMAVVRLDPLP